jgi:hypothetical protein
VSLLWLSEFTQPPWAQDDPLALQPHHARACLQWWTAPRRTHAIAALTRRVGIQAKYPDGGLGGTASGSPNTTRP